MISSFENDVFKNNACIIIDPDFTYATIFSNRRAKEMLDFVNVAPKASTIHYSSAYNSGDIPDLESIEADKYEFKDYALKRKLDCDEFKILSKRCQGILVKFGLPVLDVYGINLNGFSYGRDMGFEIVFEYVTFYVSFSLIHINSYSRRAYGFNFCNKNFIYTHRRNSGSFIDNHFKIDFSFIPSNVIDIFGNIPMENISTLPNLGIVVKNLWSSVEENSIVVYDMGNKKIVFSIGLFDSIESANLIRSVGAQIFKTIATSPNLTSGYANIATSKILSADAVEKLGDLFLINTSNDTIIQSEAEFIENKYRFLSVSHPDDSTQYKLAHSATQSTILINSCNVLNNDKTNEIVDGILGQLPSAEDNTDCHYIKSENGKIIGYLRGLSALVYSSVTDIGGEKLNRIVFSENYLKKDDFRNISAELSDVETTRESLRSDIDKYVGLVQKIDYDDIVSNVQRIDSYTANCFKSLASIIASQELMNARAAALIKAVDLILQMPLKTAYGAVDFGNLSTFIKITTKADGSSIVEQDHTYDYLIPYQKSLYQRQCFKDWCILNSDPGEGLENDVLVGSAYRSSMSDLQGNHLTTVEKIYVKTNRQTRGSGKSEQEVIPRTTLEPRIVMKLQKLIDQAISFLDTILNNDIIKASKQISECVASCNNAAKRYADMRKPYLDELIELRENQEQLFAARHFLKILEQRIPEEMQFEFGSDCFVEATDNEEDGLSSLQIAMINSVTNCIMKHDKIFDFTKSSDLLREINGRLVNANTKYLINLRDYCESSFDPSVFEDQDDIFEFNTYYDDLSMLVDDESKELKGTSNLNGSTTKTIYLKYYENEHMDRSEWFSFIENLMNESNSAYLDKLMFVNKIKKELIDLRDQPEVFYSLAENVEIDNYDDHVLAHYHGNRIYYDISIEEKEDDHVYNMTLIPNIRKSIINEISNDRTIFIGNLAFDVEIFAKQFFIYNSIPKVSNIVRKIKYAIFNNTEVSNDKLISKVRADYDNVISSSLARYINKENESLDDKVAAIVLCLLTDSKRTIASILSLQGYTLNDLLQENGLSSSVGGNIITSSSKLAI